MSIALSLANPADGQLTGHKGQRATVLLLLKREQGLTAKDLGARLGVSLNAVRHHLKELDAAGLIEHHREHRGVGAPTFAYRLSAAGEALFPRRYEEALTALLDQVVEQQGREAAVGLLEGYFSNLARGVRDDLTDASPGDRLRILGRVLSEAGYMAEVSVGQGEGTLREHNCAIPSVAARFPEICAAEARFLAELLGADISRSEHILSGCSACEYHVRFKTAQEST
jgi:DeoR family transcriptional regulator, suf operon transcriptional repressor